MNSDAAATSGISSGSTRTVRSSAFSHVDSRSPSARASASVRLGMMVPAA